MRTGFALILALLLPIVPAHAAQPTAAGALRVEVTLSGNATHLPKDAVLDATLEDVSRADAQAIVLGHAHAAWSGPTMHLTIGYDTAKINPSGRYTVRARLSSNEQLLYISDKQHSVLTRGAADLASLQLVPVTPATSAAASSDTPLTGTLWVLAEIDGMPAARIATTRTAHLHLDAEKQQASGSGGCNRYSGGYTLSGDALSFGALAATKMACLDDSGTQEPIFLKALAATRHWQIDGNELQLLDAKGTVLLRFAGRTVLQ